MSGDSVHVWFLIGLVMGAGVYIVSGVRSVSDARRRTMSDRAALGYRAALGEDPVTVRLRRSATRDP